MTPEEAALLQQNGAVLGVHLDEAALGRIERFLDVLAVWNRRVRLTSERDRRSVLVRHVVDSLAPARWLPAAGLVIDVGSGAGFPGIILACLRPELPFALIEARRRRASFLGEATRTIPLHRVRVVGARAEEVTGDEGLARSARVVITRALRLDVFLSIAAPFVAPDGVVIAMGTPGSREAARKTAEESGFRLSDTYDYGLPDARKRSLLLFTRQ